MLLQPFTSAGRSSSTYLLFVQKLIKILYILQYYKRSVNEWGKYSIESKKYIDYIRFKINNKLQFLSLFCSEDFVAVYQNRNLIVACEILSDNTEEFTIPRL